MVLVLVLVLVLENLDYEDDDEDEDDIREDKGLRFLICGLGSMGKRRVRNLSFLKAGEIMGFDPRQDRREEAETKYGIRTIGEFGAAMSLKPDTPLISTPPHLHMPYMQAAPDVGIHFFR